MAVFSPRDPVLTWSVRIVGALLIGALAFLGLNVFQGQREAQQGTLAARAIANLEAAVREDPDNADVRIVLGDAYRDTGRAADAIEQYQKALDIDADNPVALSGLALVAMGQEEWRTADGYWQKAIEVLSDNQFAAQDLRLEKAYFYYGTTLIKLAEYEDAVLYLKEALRIKRSDADTHYALSVAYRELGSVNNQRSSLEAALLFVPSMPEANYDLGMLYLADGDEATAAELFRKAVDSAPNREEPLDELLKLGPFEDRFAAAKELAKTDAVAALPEARIAASLEPTDIEAVRLVAHLLQEVGSSPEDQKAAWQRLLNIIPNDPEATGALEALGTES